MNKRTTTWATFLLIVAILLSGYRGSGRITEPVAPPSQVGQQIDYLGAYD